MTTKILGHETTSGTLTFAFYEMLRSPKVYKAAREEVDRVVGKNKVTVEHLSKLPYINAILRETLRLNSPIKANQLFPNPFENTEDPILLGGKYEVRKGETITILLEKMHTDPKIWGDDALEFNPDRMLEEKFQKLPKNAWHVRIPFTLMHRLA